MFGIKLLKVLLIAAILLVVLLLGVEFSTLNANPVPVDYLLDKTTVPLSLVVVCAFAAGVLLTSLVGAFVVLPLRWRVARLRQAVADKDQEISLLAKKAGRSAPCRAGDAPLGHDGAIVAAAASRCGLWLVGSPTRVCRAAQPCNRP